MAKFTQYALAAARQALDDAEWKPKDDLSKERTVMRKWKEMKREVTVEE